MPEKCYVHAASALPFARYYRIIFAGAPSITLGRGARAPRSFGFSKKDCIISNTTLYNCNSNILI